MEESGQDEHQCIVDHPGFEACCLNPWVLEVASVGLKTRTKRSYSTTRTEMNAAQSEYVIQLLFSINRPCHGFWRHLGWETNMAKITVNVSDFGPLGTATTPLQRGVSPQRKCILKDICIEIIFMKYIEVIQVVMTVNYFLRFHINPSIINIMPYYLGIRSHVRRFIIRILLCSLIFCWMNDINKTIFSGKCWKSASF